MSLFVTLLINALATFGAGTILLVAPDLIWRVFGIPITPAAYFIVYLLGASELSWSLLSGLAMRLNDPASLRVIALACIVLHAISGAAGIFAVVQGSSVLVLLDVTFRGLMTGLFFWYGLQRISSRAAGDLESEATH